MIGVIGMFASVVKVVTDAVEEQMRKRTPPEVVREPTVSPAPSVVQSCPNCGRQIVDPSVIYCPECGAKITK